MQFSTTTQRFIATTALAAGLATTAPAYATDAGDWYLGGQAGLAIMQDANLQGDIELEGEFDTGVVVSGAVGYGLTDAIRTEVEISYQQNDNDSLTVTNDGGLGLNGATVPADGDTSVFTVMLNGYYDIDTGTALTPFVGAGIGFASISTDTAVGNVKVADDSDTVFAYQAKLGLSYALSDALSLDGVYSYLGSQDADLKDTDGDSFDMSQDSHRFTVGLRYTF